MIPDVRLGFVQHHNDATPITALIDQAPLYNLGGSIGPELRVADLLDPAELADVALDYGASPVPRRCASWWPLGSVSPAGQVVGV